MTNIPFKESNISDRLNSIKFRGPDNTGILKIGDIVLGHLRLAILDLEERSNQPMVFGNLTIVFNGEIYNFLSVRDELIELGYQFSTTSDTEVLIAGYKQWGADVLQKLNGMFAFAIYNTSNQTVFCARDRVGVKPFFYYWKEGAFEICSQLRPLINSTSKVSSDAISMYLDCGYIPTPYSIIQNVFKLPPGHYLEIDLNQGTKKITEFWNLHPIREKNISYDDAKDQLHELLIDAVRIRLRSDVPLGSFLSGGIDSALVSSIAAKISQDPINTFTIGFDDPEFDESKVAAEFAKIIGSNHVETKCTPKDALKMLTKLIEVYDEPFADSSALPSLLLNSVTKKFATVALSGDGGDESFLGYNHFDSVAKFAKLRLLPTGIRKLIAGVLKRILNNDNYRHILRTKTINDFIESIFIGYDTLQKKRNKSWIENFNNYKTLSSSPIQKAADLNIKLWLENDSNVKVDRASMAYSVEVRSPFLDYRVIEFARTLPVHYRYQKGRRKRILRDILREYIPEEIFDQPKKGFSIPIAQWIREDLKIDIVAELNDSFLNRIPNLDVKKFKKQLDQHFTGQCDYSFNIWKLYMLAKWYKEFNL